jgi:hypothetical protein
MYGTTYFIFLKSLKSQEEFRKNPPHQNSPKSHINFQSLGIFSKIQFLFRKEIIFSFGPADQPACLASSAPVAHPGLLPPPASLPPLSQFHTTVPPPSWPPFLPMPAPLLLYSLAVMPPSSCALTRCDEPSLLSH